MAKLTPEQFAAKIREKHPGAYDDIPDRELTARILAKMPDYGDMVDLDVPAPAPAPTGKVRTPGLDAMGVSGEEIKRRAAAGEENVQTGLRRGSVGEQAAAYGVEALTGAAEGLGGLVGLTTDVVTAPVRAARSGFSADGSVVDKMKAAAGGVLELPATRTATAAADDLRTQTRKMMGIDGVQVGPAGDLVRFAADVATPGPEVVGAARQIKRGAKVAGAAPNPAAAVPAPAAPSKLSAAITKAREFVEDDWVRVKKLQQDPTVKVTDASDPYTAEILFHGRVGSRVDDLKETVTAIDQEIVSTAKEAKLPDAEVKTLVDKYLHVRHAPERNAALGDGAAGITDADAAKEMAAINAHPLAPKVKAIADKLQALSNKTLDVLLEGEVISKDLYDKLVKKYPNHIPLNRIMENDADVGALLSGRPLDVRSTGIKAAKGSDKDVADITTNIVTNYEQAILRAEKNRVDLATLRFARDNKHLGLFTEIKPKAIGKGFNDQIIMNRVNDDPRVLTLREGGKPVYLQIEDPKLAAALRGINRHKVDGVLKVVGGYTRLMSSLATRFNPEFFIPNKVRDIQEAMIYAASKGGAKSAAKVGIKDPASVVDVMAAMRGANTPGAQLYRQMKADGGTTGGMGLSTRAATELSIEQIRKTNRSSTRNAARQVLQKINSLNAVFEDSTRLTVYKDALDRGLSRTQAARMAKEASINFNKFGTGGPQINALYMFANASIQGSAKMLRAMRNPKVAGAVTAAVGTAVFSTAEWNDRVDPNWREPGRVSKYDKLSSLVVMLPPSKDGSSNYIKIPVSWGIKPIKVAFDHAEGLMSGQEGDPAEAVQATLAAAIDAYNPAGGTDAVSAITPTALDLPVDIGRNRAWHGGVIRPEWDRTAPDAEKYFEGLNETATGRAAIAATEGMASAGIDVSPADIKYAYDALVGGTGRAATKAFNTGAALAKGESPDPNEVPFANRFFERIPQDRIDAAAEADALRKDREEERKSRLRDLASK